MKKLGRDIPAAELEVMGALWRLKSATVREVLEELEGQGRRLAYTTVLTLLARLERRGYVQANRERQAHVYRPRISCERVTAERMGSLSRQLGGGQAVPLILRLVEAQNLSAGDLRELRGLLSRLEDEARRRGEPGGSGKGPP
jgi:BlaI family penicillinase repressor